MSVTWWTSRCDELRAQISQMHAINKIEKEKDEHISKLKEKSLVDQIQNLKETNLLLMEKNDLLKDKIKFLEEQLAYQKSIEEKRNSEEIIAEE